MLRARLYGLLPLVLGALAWSSCVPAYSSYGLGTLECRQYLEKRSLDQRSGTMDNTVFMHSYLSGYLTAGNMMRGLVGESAADITVNVHAIVQWLDIRCQEDPDERVAAALEVFWAEASAAKEQLKRMTPQEIEALRQKARADETP